MSSKYHILWIDDEWDSMTSFKKHCLFEYKMELHPFKTQKEGLDAYALNPDFYEAAILDAKVLDESEQEVANVGSLQKAVMRIKAQFHDLPYFISTGQPDLLSNDMFSSIFPHYYEKNTDDETLCQDIIKTIEETPQRRIINKYSEVFSWLPTELYTEVIGILSVVENDETTDAKVFNSIRKVLDWTMRELQKYGILAINFTGTNLNDCSRFLALPELQEYVPQYMQRQIHSCCTIANEGSHRLVIDENVRTGVAPFLIRSTVFELLNILMWMHQLPIDDETRRKITNIAVNCSAKFKKEEPSVKEEPQEPQYDEEFHVWHCGDTMIGLRTWEGGKVLVLDRQENTSNNPRIKEKYPYFAKYKKI